MKRSDWKRFEKYFSWSEFDSKDKPDSGLKMQVEFMEQLYEARKISKVPFIINSGYRTKERNKRVGGVASSSHLKGKACDISCRDSRTRYELITALQTMGFRRFGIGSNFIHVDNEDMKSQNVIWYYNK